MSGFGGIDNEGSTNGSFGGRISGVANLADSNICCADPDSSCGSLASICSCPDVS
jgi:hypothetical protein